MRTRNTRNHALTHRALVHILNLLENKIMPALDDLKTAVDGAVTEMTNAVTVIQSSTAANDPALVDMAARLSAATDALKAAEEAHGQNAPSA